MIMAVVSSIDVTTTGTSRPVLSNKGNVAELYHVIVKVVVICLANSLLFTNCTAEWQMLYFSKTTELTSRITNLTSPLERSEQQN